jgi:hypothetical protein
MVALPTEAMLRKAMVNPKRSKLTGTIEIDETGET